MKKLLILALIAVLTIPSFSQEKSNVSTEKNVLKINTLSLIFGTGSLFYERKISEFIPERMLLTDFILHPISGILISR